MNRATPIVLLLAAFVAASVIYVVSGGDGSGGTSATTVFTCGADATARELTVSREAVILAGDARLFAPCPGDHDESHREARQLALLIEAAASDDAAVARLAYVALGRAGVSPIDESGDLTPWARDGLAHPSPLVRRAATVALGDALDGQVREPVSVEALIARREDAAEVRARRGSAARTASVALQQLLAGEPETDVRAAILDTLGRLPYDRPEDRVAVEALLVGRLTDGDPRARLGAALGLEYMLRRSPGSAGTNTILTLRAVAAPAASEAVGAGAVGDVETLARTRRVSMLALASARDANPPTILAAAADADWQVRRLAVLRMTGTTREMTDALAAALSDPVFQVRLEAVRLAARAAARTGRCAAVLEALDDGEAPVVLAALEAMPGGCREREDIVSRLEQLTGLLGAARDHWHVPAQALMTMAELAPAGADERLAEAASHPVWEVRAAAADVASTLGREDVAVSLMLDEEPNVRTAALTALGTMLSDRRYEAALEAVTADDFNLIRTAAGMLEDTPDPAAAVDALFETLRVLTEDAWDTSRDPRTAIVRSLAGLLPPSRAAELLPFVADFDPSIALAARDGYLALTGAPALPSEAPSQRARYPRQPTEEQLMALPRIATIELDGGQVVELELLADDAPVLVARFAELASAGHYDGLSMHRVEPNFVLQGGSPGANEYSGLDRYLRDEIGVSNWRGTVGLSTRGRDTGDAQFFVNLVDNPRLDHEYSVFARVTSGMDVLDRLAAGIRIVRIQAD